MVRIAHISDTHIRNLKFHKQYKVAFEDMYRQLRELKPDYIVHCGDIAHRKTDISPELVDMTNDFIRSMADIAPTHVILGNHDGNLRNDSRQDAISPIIAAMDNSNVHLYKYSGEFEIGDNVVLNVLSVFDKDNWLTTPSNNDKVNIALYHGSVAGCKTETGFMMEHGIDISELERFDYAMLGDIHKTNQCLDHDGRVRYCGSTIQQNHGETNDKGFLIWDIEDKKSFNVTHHEILNINPFITVVLTPKGKVPKNLELPPNARVRIRSMNQISVGAMRKAQAVIQTKYSPESTTTQNNVNGVVGNTDEAIREALGEDLRDEKTQEKLIREYLKDFELREDVLSEVLHINRRMNTIAFADKDEVSRNIHWKLKSLEWDNLFNYGMGNKVDFERLSGVVGIFGENYSGKSSTIDSLCYALFNNTTKNVRKSYNIINQNKEKCRAKAIIDIAGKDYVVERRSEKYIKRLKGEISNEAKTDVDFLVSDMSGDMKELNGTSKTATDKNIAKYFGSIEDFLLTSMSSQTDSLTFLKEGSTKRKEILAKFLDLVLFEEKFVLAKAEAADLKGLVKALDSRNYGSEIGETAADLVRNENALKAQKKECSKTKKKLEKLRTDVSNIDSQISSIPAEIIDAKKTKKQIKELKQEVKDILSSEASSQKSLADATVSLEKMNEFLSTFNIEEYEATKKEISSLEEEIAELTGEHEATSRKVNTSKKKSSLLDEVPCGDKYLTCKFLTDASSAREELPSLKDKLYSITSQKAAKTKQLENLDPETVESRMDKHQQLLNKKSETERVISESRLLCEKFALEAKEKERHIEDLEKEIEIYEENKEAIENLESLVKTKKDKEIKIGETNACLGDCEEMILELYKTNGSLEEKLASLEKDRETLNQKREEYAAYDYFLQCMHPHGISSDIVKRRLPVINAEITKVLSNVVDFEIYLETDGRKLDIMIKHPKFDPRPIELGSGAEKTLAAIAIRLALLSVSTLPRGDVFILDEPGTALDENNMEGFSRIVDMIKIQFNKVILISHLDSLKDAADMTIDIDKKDGFAHIEQ
jgi:DNA repair exonuclease SbcCD ATPase subunit/DNA repair exonuclease SbcCD nuclease subunit